MSDQRNDAIDEDLPLSLRRAYAELGAWRARSNRLHEPARSTELARVSSSGRVIEPIRLPDPARR